MDGETLWKRLSFTVFISFHVIIFAQSKPLLCMHLYELPLSRCPSLSPIRNYERKTKKTDSSFCRGPLMISLKWLTALNSTGNLLQSKQIWSVLETEPGGSLGEGCNMSVCMCVEWGEVGGGDVNEGDLRGSHWGYGEYCCRQVPTQTPSPAHTHTLLLSPPSYTQSHLCHIHFNYLYEHNKYISSLLMNAIWQPWGWQAGEDGPLIRV